MKKIAATLAAIAAFAIETPVRVLTRVDRSNSSISKEERKARTRLRKQKERQRHA